MADLKRLQTAVEVGDRETAIEVTQQAIDEDIPPKTVLDAMTDAMGVVGQRFQDNEIYVPEMLISARAMKAAVALLEPLLIGTGYKPDSVAVMGTIKGDLHDIGKNLVAMMLEGAGFNVIDLGVQVSPEKVIAGVHPPDGGTVRFEDCIEGQTIRSEREPSGHVRRTVLEHRGLQRRLERHAVVLPTAELLRAADEHCSGRRQGYAGLRVGRRRRAGLPRRGRGRAGALRPRRSAGWRGHARGPLEGLSGHGGGAVTNRINTEAMRSR